MPDAVSLVACGLVKVKKPIVSCGCSIILQHACRCFEQVTCKAVTIRNLETANELVDSAIAAAMQEKKPVLIQVCSPLTDLPVCNVHASAAVMAVL